MSTDLFRKYIDIVNEGTQPQQLDEGVLDSLKSKVQSVVSTVVGNASFAPYYKQARVHSDEIVRAFTSSKSADEFLSKIKSMAAGAQSQSQSQTNEAWNDGRSAVGKIAGSVGAGIVSVAASVFSYVYDMFGNIINMINAIPPEQYRGLFQGIDYSKPISAADHEAIIQFFQGQQTGMASVMFLVIPLAYAVWAYESARQAKKDIDFNKQHYPKNNPITGKSNS